MDFRKGIRSELFMSLWIMCLVLVSFEGCGGVGL